LPHGSFGLCARSFGNRYLFRQQSAADHRRDDSPLGGVRDIRSATRPTPSPRTRGNRVSSLPLDVPERCCARKGDAGFHDLENRDAHRPAWNLSLGKIILKAKNISGCPCLSAAAPSPARRGGCVFLAT